MELAEYFSPFDSSRIRKQQGTLINKVLCDQEKIKSNLKKAGIALVGVPYSSENIRVEQSTSLIRDAFYALADPYPDDFRILDLGDLKKGKTYKDTWVGLRDVLQYLTSRNLFTIVLGGSSLFKSSLLQSQPATDGPIDFVSVEPCISLYSEWDRIPDKYKKSIYYNTVGSQIYYLKREEKEWMDKEQFQDYRLGDVRSSLINIEPVLRDALITTISINSIKHADAPGQETAVPNGLYGEEIAQIARFVGLADKTKVFGLFDYFPEKDRNNQTSQLAAQLCWFVTEGYLNRYPEEPRSGEEIKKFIVNQNDSSYELVFYKSEKTERWWMEIPYKGGSHPEVFACSYDDYRLASEQELPVRWIRLFQRFNLEEG